MGGFKTFGCLMNELDSELIRQQLLYEGYIEVEKEKNAEIILINTCSVRKKAEEKAIHYSSSCFISSNMSLAFLETSLPLV